MRLVATTACTEERSSSEVDDRKRARSARALCASAPATCRQHARASLMARGCRRAPCRRVRARAGSCLMSGQCGGTRGLVGHRKVGDWRGLSGRPELCQARRRGGRRGRRLLGLGALCRAGGEWRAGGEATSNVAETAVRALARPSRAQAAGHAKHGARAGGGRGGGGAAHPFCGHRGGLAPLLLGCGRGHGAAARGAAAWRRTRVTCAAAQGHERRTLWRPPGTEGLLPRACRLPRNSRRIRAADSGCAHWHVCAAHSGRF